MEDENVLIECLKQAKIDNVDKTLTPLITTCVFAFNLFMTTVFVDSSIVKNSVDPFLIENEFQFSLHCWVETVERNKIIKINDKNGIIKILFKWDWILLGKIFLKKNSKKIEKFVRFEN